MKPRAIERLQTLASEIVGDGKTPNLFFVTDRGVTITVTRNAERAYWEWLDLASRRPRIESTLEDRRNGVLASVEPCASGDLCIYDDFERFTLV